ncbi:hypothetical protein POTOM_006213 [Populus tomentosa]|uniref:Uncharacterized protein n=1 Tax=Populus tomentosa TaxID=118781 RepID=A0A8X8ANU2_POPTO|nr:hypothetical protein POTOM_006213 [Populus tomentosa]
MIKSHPYGIITVVVAAAEESLAELPYLNKEMHEGGSNLWKVKEDDFPVAYPYVEFRRGLLLEVEPAQEEFRK